MGIVAEIPWLQDEVLALLLTCHFLECLYLLHGSRFIGIDELVEQSVNISRVAGHSVFQHIVGIGVIS